MEIVCADNLLDVTCITRQQIAVKNVTACRFYIVLSTDCLLYATLPYFLHSQACDDTFTGSSSNFAGM